MADYLPLERLLPQGRAADYPVALRDGRVWDFTAFRQEAAAWQAAFAADPGQRYALYFQDTAHFSAALFGAWHAGKCVYLPSDAQPATLARLREEVDGFAGDFEAAGLHCLHAKAATLPAWQPLATEAMALVVYTSGSTGEPSAIPKRLGQLFDEVTTLAACFEHDLTGATVLATVSHQHIYGLLFRVLWPLAAGRAFVAERLAFSEDIAAALAKHGPCALVASPAHLKRLPASLPWAPGRSLLRKVFSSGGPLPQESLPDCRLHLGQAPVEVYGSSETGGIAWRQRHDDAQTGWQALPGVEIRLTESSCLAVRSPHLPDDNWLITADCAQLSASGFELLGRSDRIVKIEEKRVSLTAMETALQASGLLAEARLLVRAGTRTVLAVAGVPTEAGWQIVETEGKRALNLRLRERLADLAEASVLPRHWRYVSALPVNAQSKTTDEALQALFDPRWPATRLLARSDASASLRLYISTSLPYFDGHFPAAPILPGVAQLEWVAKFGREYFPLPARFLRMDAVKFQQVITPGTVATLELDYNAARATLSFKIHSAAGMHAGGRFLFGVD